MDLGIPFVWGLGEGPTDLRLEPPQATFISETPRVWSPTLLGAGGCLWGPTAFYSGDQPFFSSLAVISGTKGVRSGRRPLAMVSPSVRAITGAYSQPGQSQASISDSAGSFSEDTQLRGALRVGCLALTLHPVGVTRSHYESEFSHLQNRGPGWDDPVSQGHL